MSWGPLFSPNSIKFNYSWSSSGGMFCESSGGLVCSFQIDIVIELLIFSPPFFVPNSQQFIQFTHWNLAGKLYVSNLLVVVCQRSKYLCAGLRAFILSVDCRNQKCGVLRCLPLLLHGRSRMKAALVLRRDSIQSAPRRGESKERSSLGTELPLLGVLFAFKLWLFFVSGQIYCRGMLASLLALNAIVLTSLLS